MAELSRGLLDTSVLIAREEDPLLESSLPQEIAAFAKEHAGSDFDLDGDLEAAGIEAVEAES